MDCPGIGIVESYHRKRRIIPFCETGFDWSNGQVIACHSPEGTPGRCEGAHIATDTCAERSAVRVSHIVVEILRGVYPEPVEGLRMTGGRWL